MFIKKSIILSNKKSNANSLAVLKLDNSSSSHTYCTIKGYNLNSNEYVLGVANGDNVTKQNIFFDKNNVYNFKLNRLDDEKSIHLVLTENVDNTIQPVVWNSDTTHKAKIINTLSSTIKRIDKVTSSTKLDENINITISNNENNTTNEDDNKNIEQLFEDDTNLDELIDEMVENSDETVTTASNDNKTNYENVENETTNNNEPTFYEQRKDQLDELFDKYPREEKLEQLVDNSKWVKIEYDKVPNKHYVVGVIYDGDTIKYICFGVPGTMDTPPEDDLKEYSQWLPCDILNPKDNGYWVMYQDATNGKNIILD